MKNYLKFLPAVLAVALLFASCDKKKNDPVDELPKDVVIPEVLFESYYVGDYYENGVSGNLLVNFVTGNIDLNEDETEYIGNGQIVCLDLNIALPLTVEEADQLHLPEGTYSLSDDNHAPFTWNAEESYVIKVENDKAVIDEVTFKEGDLVIEKTANGVKLVLKAKLKDDTDFSYEYEGLDRIINHSDDSKFTNLDKDVKVKNLVAAAYSNLGDVVGDGKTNTWVVSLGDKYYDFKQEYGNGESVLLFLNVEPDAKELPEGKITEFADLNYTEVLEPNTLVAGYFMWGTYGGTWYKCPAYAYEAAIVGGEVEIVKTGDDTYSITGTLKDAYQKTVSFSYSGEVKQMEYKE